MKRALIVLVSVALFALPSATWSAPPPISIEAPSTATTTDSSGVDLEFTVTSHLDLPVTCTPTGGPATSFTTTYHFPVGTTTIDCTDGTNEATDSVTVTYNAPDTTPPTISVPSDITAEATSGSGAVVTYTVSASDNSGVTPTVNCDHPSGSTFPLGQTTVTCTATDSANNTSAPASFSVTVQDTTPPSLNLPGPITTAATSGAGAVVTYSASATDAVSGSPPVTCNPPSGSTFPIGSTTVNCSASDGAGHTTNGSFSVTVTDSAGPTFSNVPASRTVEANGPSGSVVNYTAPTATDAVDGPIAAVNCAPASGSLFSLGAHTVTCSAADSHGNPGTASFTITVVDSTPPSLIVPADRSVYADTPDGISVQNHYVAEFLSEAQAVDSVDPHPVVSNAAGDFLSVGTHVIAFSARDASGNTVVKTATLVVLPMPPPGTPPITPPPPRTAPKDVTSLKAEPGDSRVRLSWQLPDGVDHVVITAGLSAGGPTSVVYTGSGESTTVRGLVNGLEYRFSVVSLNKAGDSSAGVAAVAVPKATLLKSPKDGARLKAPPKLVWARNSEAAYYNVQLFRGNVKILSTWPTSANVVLKRTWKYRGRTYTLKTGVYRWYVWPGFGPRAAVDYGEMLGFRTFQIVR